MLSGLAHKNGIRARRRPRRPRARGRVVPHRRASAQDRRRRHPERHLGRSDRRAAPRRRRRGSPSLELGCDDSRTVGNCDSGYSCAYTNSLAWRGPTTPMPPETNPRLVFERLFGDIDTSLPPESRARRLLLSPQHPRSRRRAHARARRRISGPSDRRKLDEYLSSIREIEQRIEKAEKDLTGLTPDDRQADRHPGALRRLRQADVRSAARRVPDRPRRASSR